MADSFSAYPDDLVRAAGLVEATAEQLRATVDRPGLQAPGALGPANVSGAFSAFLAAWNPYGASYVAQAESVGPRLRASALNYRTADDQSCRLFDAGGGPGGPAAPR